DSNAGRRQGLHQGRVDRRHCRTLFQSSRRVGRSRRLRGRPSFGEAAGNAKFFARAGAPEINSARHVELYFFGPYESMIRKSGSRFSAKIMLRQDAERQSLQSEAIVL